MGDSSLSDDARKKIEASFDERRTAYQREVQQDLAAYRREVGGANRKAEGDKSPPKPTGQK